MASPFFAALAVALQNAHSVRPKKDAHRYDARAMQAGAAHGATPASGKPSDGNLDIQQRRMLLRAIDVGIAHRA